MIFNSEMPLAIVLDDRLEVRTRLPQLGARAPMPTSSSRNSARASSHAATDSFQLQRSTWQSHRCTHIVV